VCFLCVCICHPMSGVTACWRVLGSGFSPEAALYCIICLASLLNCRPAQAHVKKHIV
jgi:hypothetical protein